MSSQFAILTLDIMVSRRILKSQPLRNRHWPIVSWSMVIVGGLVAVYALFPPVPIVTHDNNYELWLNAFDQLIRTGKLFPDWIKAFSLGHGNPLFVFYPPLFFYLAEIPRLLGTNLVVAVKVIVAFSTLAAFSQCIC